jgi:hypothetical protein
VSSHFGSWSFDRLLNLQRVISRGQNPLDWRVPYFVGNFLECRCLKWACMTHLDTSNASYGQKKGRESNWQFDSRSLKVRNRPSSLRVGAMQHIVGKFSTRATTLFRTSFQSKAFTQNYGPPKSWESQLW